MLQWIKCFVRLHHWEYLGMTLRFWMFGHEQADQDQFTTQIRTVLLYQCTHCQDIHTKTLEGDFSHIAIDDLILKD